MELVWVIGVLLAVATGIFKGVSALKDSLWLKGVINGVINSDDRTRAEKIKIL